VPKQCTLKRLVLRIFVGLVLSVYLVLPSAVFAQRGTRESGEITSPALEGNLLGDSATKRYNIYLPPSYDTTSDKRYPVIYVLHGYTGTESGLFGLVSNTLDAMIESGEVREMIAVFPNGSNRLRGSWYRNSPTIGDYETYITQDLVGHIDANYRTLPSRENRGITGESMGGYGTMHLALAYPEIFSVAVPQAGIYDFDNSPYTGWANQVARANPTDFAGFNRLPVLPQASVAYAAAASPNPDNPPLYLDFPLELVEGTVTTIDEIWARHVETDVIHGDLGQYVAQPFRLRGIKIVHGTSDGIVPISQARALDAAMTDLGIEHEYKEHAGGHDLIPVETVQFMSDNLAFEILPEVVSVEAHGKLATTWATIKQSR
jgi:enterochelin esterase-like enzyme